MQTAVSWRRSDSLTHLTAAAAAVRLAARAAARFRRRCAGSPVEVWRGAPIRHLGSRLHEWPGNDDFDKRLSLGLIRRGLLDRLGGPATSVLTIAGVCTGDPADRPLLLRQAPR